MITVKDLTIDKVDLNEGIVKIVFGASKLGDGDLVGQTDFEFMSSLNSVEFVEEELERGRRNILFDMKNIRRVDSTGLWTVFECHKKSQKRNVKFGIINVNEFVMKRFKSTTMDKQVNIFETEKEAIEFLR